MLIKVRFGSQREVQRRLAGTGLGLLCAPENCAGRRACLQEGRTTPHQLPKPGIQGVTQPCIMSRDEWEGGGAGGTRNWGRGNHTSSVGQRSWKALSFFSPNRLIFARGNWKAHCRPVIDPLLLV